MVCSICTTVAYLLHIVTRPFSVTRRPSYISNMIVHLCKPEIINWWIKFIGQTKAKTHTAVLHFLSFFDQPHRPHGPHGFMYICFGMSLSTIGIATSKTTMYGFGRLFRSHWQYIEMVGLECTQYRKGNKVGKVPFVHGNGILLNSYFSTQYQWPANICKLMTW